MLKWPGGKTEDLTHIQNDFGYLLPDKIKNYYEPFLGGGAMWLTVGAPSYVNDLCQELITFYEMIRDQNEEFFRIIEGMTNDWQLLTDIASAEAENIYWGKNHNESMAFVFPYREQIKEQFFVSIYKKEYFDILSKSLTDKIKNIQKVRAKKGDLSHEDITKNIEGALKSGYYTMIRNIFNQHKPIDPLKVACFYFLRDYCFASMFRYNKRGRFNVPYGGISYNLKKPNQRVKYWQDSRLIEHLKSSQMSKLDFYDFFQQNVPTKSDFIFVDPPYDSDFSTYAGNQFDRRDQGRLANYLIYECKAKFMNIMKSTTDIKKLYEDKPGVECFYFDKSYSVSFRDRNDRDVSHIIVVRR